MALLSGSRKGDSTVTEKQSRFDGLFGAVKAVRATKSNAQMSERLDIQTSGSLDVQTSKGKDPNYQRTTIYLPKPLHRQFKAAAATDGKEMSTIVEELVQMWLEERNV